MKITKEKLRAALQLLLALWCAAQGLVMLPGAHYSGAADAIYSSLAHMKLLDISAAVLLLAIAAALGFSLKKKSLLLPALIALLIWHIAYGWIRYALSFLTPFNIAACCRMAVILIFIIYLFRKGEYRADR